MSVLHAPGLPLSGLPSAKTLVAGSGAVAAVVLALLTLYGRLP